MTITIKYKNKLPKKNHFNNVLFVDEKFNISGLRKHITKPEFNFLADLIKVKDLKTSILDFDLSSKKKIVLVSFKKNITSSEAEKLGAKFYTNFKNLKIKQYNINSSSISNKFSIILGHFLHGIKLKSYKFEKYKSTKDSKNLSIFVTGKNIPSLKDQAKFKALEDGTFYTRDLVSEPGNILHPDEYAKRISSLKKIGL